ncbi:MAG TPA: MgtC/SapB family protein [Rhodospirillales bacterium]|nr:MgtC/SapB family protein [Rhodospirillales bacterium]
MVALPGVVEEEMGTLEPVDLLLRLVATVLCGGLIGLERELRRKPAGLRTMMLVAVGSSVFALIALEVTRIPGGYDSGGDMGRILQGVVAGLGMLGAGLFLHRDTTVRLATSGAGVWLAGAAGMACGLGLFLLASLATGLALLVLAGIGWAERHLPGRKHVEPGQG